MGITDGSIIATIITTHMPMKDAAAPNHVCPAAFVHTIDIIQPPGIAIPPIVAIDEHQAIVSRLLAANTSTETPRNPMSLTFLPSPPFLPFLPFLPLPSQYSS